MQCSQCGHSNKAAAKFCEECGAALQAPPCASCGHALSLSAKYCENCGAPVQSGSSTAKVGSAESQSHARPDKARNKPRRTALVLLGAILVVVGVFLPWIRESSSFGVATANGIELNEGVISVGLGIANILLGFIAADRSLSAKAAAFAIFLTGIAVVGVTGNWIQKVEQQRISVRAGQDLSAQLGQAVNYHVRTEPGVFVTLGGGGALTLGGLVAMMRARGRRR